MHVPLDSIHIHRYSRTLTHPSSDQSAHRPGRQRCCKMGALSGAWDGPSGPGRSKPPPNHCCALCLSSLPSPSQTSTPPQPATRTRLPLLLPILLLLLLSPPTLAYRFTDDDNEEGGFSLGRWTGAGAAAASEPQSKPESQESHRALRRRRHRGQGQQQQPKKKGTAFDFYVLATFWCVFGCLDGGVGWEYVYIYR